MAKAEQGRGSRQGQTIMMSCCRSQRLGCPPARAVNAELRTRGLAGARDELGPIATCLVTRAGVSGDADGYSSLPGMGLARTFMTGPFWEYITA